MSDEAKKLVTLLADHLGISAGDISTEDYLREDLHMSASDISELADTLNSEGLEVDSANLTQVETVADLISAVVEGEEL